MRRLLRLPEGTTATAEEARSAFQKSIFISAARCVLMYIFFPFVLPLIGVAKGVGPVIGLIIGVLAIVSITFSIRRFWRANHSKRWHYTIFGIVIIGFLIVLAVKDFAHHHRLTARSASASQTRHGRASRARHRCTTSACTTSTACG